MVGERGQQVARCGDRAGGAGGIDPGVGQVALISTRPVSSPTGRAPARHNLMPLYWAGLCEAVNMAPGRRATGGEVEEVGGRQAEVDHVEALAGAPLGEGGRQVDAGGAHVAADEDRRPG